PLSEVDAKLVRAAARTAHTTGLPIASHTTTGAAAMAELDLLDRAGVPAKAGAWVEFDGLSDTTVERHVELVRRMKTEGLLGRVLVSHDAGWFHVGEPD